MSSDTINKGYQAHLRDIIEEDFQVLLEKDEQYGSSWKKRGGVSAFMMLARKWDRIQRALEPLKEEDCNSATLYSNLAAEQDIPVPPYDVIAAGVWDDRTEGILDDIRDLKNYLTLVQAEIRYQKEKA